jgi:hypothetical protein
LTFTAKRFQPRHGNVPELYDHALHLAREGSWARIGVAGGNRVVDIDENARVRGAIGSWEGDKVLRLRAAATTDVELSTRKVKLGAPLTRSGVKSNMFISHQILPRRDTLWKCDVIVGGACEGKSQ